MRFLFGLLVDHLLTPGRPKTKKTPATTDASKPSEPLCFARSREERVPPDLYCSTDPAMRARAAQMDPLLARGHHNLVCSRLGRLPEHLLLAIMVLLDPGDHPCLRHVCRLFLRLYESPEFRPCLPRDQGNLPWGLPAFDHASGALAVPHASDRRPCADASWPALEGYCHDCRADQFQPLRRLLWSWRRHHLGRHRLYCGGCDAYHPRALFSAQERRNSHGRDRVCVLHEGVVRLCSHETVSLAAVTDTAMRQMTQLLGSGAKRSVVRLAHCQDPSHWPQHVGDAVPLWTVHNATPSLYVVVDLERQQVALDLRWNGHLPLPVDVQGRPTNVTPADLEARLRRLRRGVAEHILPALPHGRLPEMTLVDPNRCACLHLRGSALLAAGWVLSGPRSDYPPRACLMDDRKRLWPQGNSGVAASGERKPDSELPKAVSHATCLQRSSQANGASYVHVGLRPCSCRHQPPCLEVGYSAIIEVCQTAMLRTKDKTYLRLLLPKSSWLVALDPASYNVRNDPLRRGISWCSNADCQNVFQPVMAFSDMYWCKRYARWGHWLRRVNMEKQKDS